MLDGAQRVTGSALFAGSVELPNTLHGKLLRSPHAHARIRRLDVSRAERLPGVAAVITAAKILASPLNLYYGPVLPDRPLLAHEKVRFYGEPVAAVVAVDEDTAAAALDLIEVDYEPLPALARPEQAVGLDAPAIHDGVRTRDFLTFPDLVLNTEAGNNIFNHYKLRKGDVEAGFAQAARIFEDTYSTPHQQHCSLEPHITTGLFEGDRITLWSASSSPYTARFQVAETLGLPQSRVRIIAYNIGGAYGGKTYPRLEPLVATLAWFCRGRPVHVAFERAEEFFTITRHASQVRMRTGVDAEGRILARQVTIHWGAGAYADVSPRTIKNGGFASAGPYRIPNLWVDSYAVYTNTTPSGGFRGYAVPQVCWAYETQMDRIAAELGIDPLELRRRNLLHDGDRFSTDQLCEHLHLDELLDAVAARVDWGKPDLTPRPPSLEGRGGRGAAGLQSSDFRRRGRGLACTIKGTITPSTSTASVKLNEDGSATVLTSTTEVGQGSRTVLAQLAADALGLPLERVAVSFADTDVTPWDQTTSSSRSTAMMGAAVQKAAAEVREQLLELAAGALEAAPSDLLVEDGQVRVRGAPERALEHGAVVRASRRGNLLGSGTHQTEGGLDNETGLGIATSHFSQAAAGAEVEVDTETGAVRVLKLHVASYAGVVVNPTLAELQNEGNIAFGVGQALQEQMIYDDGRLVNPNLADYLIPSIEDLPAEWGSDLIEDADGRGTIHGLGEAGAPPVPPAIGNAIHDAVGIRLERLPISPEEVLRLLRARGAGSR
jgi:CO/xanthine dehydrogenase Mo-binding subunit